MTVTIEKNTYGMFKPAAIQERAAERKTLAGTIFSTAISVIRRKGWVQGTYHADGSQGGAVCLMGAVEDAILKVLGITNANGEELRDATGLVSTYLCSEYPSLFEGRTPEGFNDTPGRSQDDVITALETIAAKEASTPFDHLLLQR